jgi:peptidoglycan/xylan/chitin deacetylase (PgdA/CDA1 family)
VPAVALMYHRVTEPGRDPFGICVHPERFADHLRCIHRHAEIAPLAALSENSLEARVAITLDDGYLDNLTEARPILESSQAFATMFVVAGKVDSATEFWWDKLERLVWGPTENRGALEMTIGPRIAVRICLDDDAAREQALWTLHSALLPLPAVEIEAFLSGLAASLQLPDEGRSFRRSLTGAELVELTASRTVEIGAHSMTHAALPALSVQEQAEEIATSRSSIERMIGRSVSSFAYPFGEYDGTTAKLVREAGLRRACTVEPGLVSASTDPFRIPRYEVRDWGAAEFEAKLLEWIRQT